ncbi:MAG: hypothetical protein AAF456_20270 [Planctomycetota bacterium]
MTAIRKRRRRQPGYLVHKRSGQARVIINGKTHYLGPHVSDESHRKYHAILAEH